MNTEEIPLTETQSRSVNSSPNPDSVELNAGLNPSFSQHSIVSNSSHYTMSSTPRTPTRRKEDRVNSAYIKNSSFHRYDNSLNSIIPFRNINTNTDNVVDQPELPIDSICCLSNSTFSWINRIDNDTLKKNKDSPYYLQNLQNEKKLRLPKITYSLSADVNSRRLLGKFNDEVRSRGLIKGSMFRVVFRFLQTRLIIASLTHVLAILIGIIGFVIFLRLTLDSMHQEIEYRNNQTETSSNRTIPITSTEPENIFMKYHPSMINYLTLNFFNLTTNPDKSEPTPFLKMYLQTLDYFIQNHPNLTHGHEDETFEDDDEKDIFLKTNLQTFNDFIEHYPNLTKEQIESQQELEGKNEDEHKGIFIKTHLLTLNYFIQNHPNITASDLENSTKLFESFLTKASDQEIKEKVELNKITNNSNPVNTTAFMQLQHEVEIAQLNRIGFSLCITLCYLGYVLLKSVTYWLNLKTAIKFRTGYLAVAYKKAMKSTVAYQISPHQIMSLAIEESEILMNCITKGSLMIGTIVGIIASCVISFILLGVYGLVPLAVILLLVISYPLGKLSIIHQRKFIAHNAEKLSLIEEFCISFKNIILMNSDKIYEKKFMKKINEQYTSAIWSDIFSTTFRGHMTSAILLGALYLIWCDTDITTESIPVLILIVLFSYFTQNLFSDFFECIGYILQGKACMEKLKNSYALQSASPSKSRPASSVALFISHAEFTWNNNILPNQQLQQRANQMTLNISEFLVTKNQVTGITGPPKSGKTMLLLSILGHTNVKSGSSIKHENLAFFPENCFVTPKSFKENILLKHDFDNAKFYEAINAVRLNDIVRRPGTEDEPIGQLELNLEQLDRLGLAQAIYVDRDLILLDNPLSHMPDTNEKLLLFKNVLDILKHQNKTVIIASQSNELLSFCQNIFYLDNSQIYRQGSYIDFQNVPSYIKLTKDYEILRILNTDTLDGSNDKNISPLNAKKIKTVSISATNNHSTRDNSSEEISINIKKASQTSNDRFILGSIILFIIHLLNGAIYLTLPFAFVIVVQIEYIEPWLALVSILLLIALLLLDFVDRLYIGLKAKSSAIKHEKIKMELLNNTTLNYLYNSAISDIIHNFAQNIYSCHKIYRHIIQPLSIIIIGSAFLIFINYWTVFVVVILMCGTLGLYFYLYRTLNHFYSKEFESGREMFKYLTNNLKGRHVLYAIDRIPEYSKDFYNIVETNSVSILMQKSLLYRAEFLLQILLSGCLFVTCCILLLVPSTELHMYRYIFGILVYLILSKNYISFLIDGLFAKSVANKKINMMYKNFNRKIDERIQNEFKEKKLDLYKGFSISFRDIICTVGRVKLLEMPHIIVSNGEKIGLTGKGSHLIVPLLSRLLIPSSGTISIGEKDITSYSEGALNKIIGTIPFNLQYNRASILSVLNPNNEFSPEHITSALKLFKLWDTITMLPNKLNDSVNLLGTQEMQLLCLVRISLHKPPVIIIEKPHPNIHEIIKTTIRSTFENATVVIIGDNCDSAFEICNRVIAVDSLVAKKSK